MKFSAWKSKQGYAMMLVLVITILIVGIGTYLLSLQVTQDAANQLQRQAVQGHYVACAGLGWAQKQGLSCTSQPSLVENLQLDGWFIQIQCDNTQLTSRATYSQPTAFEIVTRQVTELQCSGL